MLTFGKMVGLIEQHPDLEGGEEGPLLDSGEEGQAMEAIRSGLHLRKKDCGDFWEDFITICGNADAMSALLEVPKEKVTGWNNKVREMLNKVDEADDDAEDSDKGKREQIPTGDKGAAPTEDTFGNDANADLRPSPS
jgi:hypothetical protein